jgi:phenylacetate-CoA ligase
MGSCHSGDPSYEDRLEDGLLHLNSRQDPTFWTDLVKDRMLDELARHETDRLVADPAYLADLADHAAASGRRLAVTGFVALTWSTTTPAHLASLARVHAGPVFQLYGTRELGATLVEAEAGRFASLPDRVLLEALPARPGVDAGLESGAEGALGLLVATTLDREIMPLVRWVTGDLVRVRDGVIVALLGRIQDAIVRPDGAWLTPADLARALGDLPFQANQRAPNEVELDVVGRHGARARSLVEGLFVGMDLDVREQSALPAEPSGRFRAARRHVPAPMARAFEGCEEGISS